MKKTDDKQFLQARAKAAAAARWDNHKKEKSSVIRISEDLKLQLEINMMIGGKTINDRIKFLYDCYFLKNDIKETLEYLDLFLNAAGFSSNTREVMIETGDYHMIKKLRKLLKKTGVKWPVGKNVSF